LSGAITGMGTLTKISAGTLLFSGTSNTYSGLTTVSAGILQASAINAFSPNSSISLAGTSTLALNGLSQIIGSLSGVSGPRSP